MSDHPHPGRHPRRALEFIGEAIQLARHTQNPQLLASAYLWQGLTYCNAFFDSPEDALECYDLAHAFSREFKLENMRRDLRILKAKIVKSGNVDSRLRAWSQEEVGDKTFRQISDEFC